MVFNLDSVSMILFSLLDNYLVTSAKRLDDSIINIHRKVVWECLVVSSGVRAMFVFQSPVKLMYFMLDTHCLLQVVAGILQIL
jgi:hypothetical protein